MEIHLLSLHLVGVWDVHTNKNCTVMTHALVELKGKWMVRHVPQVREEQMLMICLYVLMCGSADDCGCVDNGSSAVAVLFSPSIIITVQFHGIIYNGI